MRLPAKGLSQHAHPMLDSMQAMSVHRPLVAAPSTPSVNVLAKLCLSCALVVSAWMESGSAFTAVASVRGVALTADAGGRTSSSGTEKAVEA